MLIANPVTRDDELINVASLNYYVVAGCSLKGKSEYYDKQGCILYIAELQLPNRIGPF